MPSFLIQTSLKSSTSVSDTLTVLHELMKKKLEVVDQDLFIIIKPTMYPCCSSGKKLRSNWKKVFEMYGLEFILFLNLQYIILWIKASGLRWKFLL